MNTLLEMEIIEDNFRPIFSKRVWILQRLVLKVLRSVHVWNNAVGAGHIDCANYLMYSFWMNCDSAKMLSFITLIGPEQAAKKTQTTLYLEELDVWISGNMVVLKWWKVLGLKISLSAFDEFS